MYMDYTKFEEVMATAAEVFATWDENMKDFTNVAREVSRKRAEKFISEPSVAHMSNSEL